MSAMLITGSFRSCSRIIAMGHCRRGFKTPFKNRTTKPQPVGIILLTLHSSLIFFTAVSHVILCTGGATGTE